MLSHQTHFQLLRNCEEFLWLEKLASSVNWKEMRFILSKKRCSALKINFLERFEIDKTILTHTRLLSKQYLLNNYKHPKSNKVWIESSEKCKNYWWENFKILYRYGITIEYSNLVDLTSLSPNAPYFDIFHISSSCGWL